MKCKSCEGTDFQATHRNHLERVAYYAIPFHVLECQGCNEHRWGLQWKPADKFQWIGHGATLLILLALITVPFLLSAPEPEQAAEQQAQLESEPVSPGDAALLEEQVEGAVEEQDVKTAPSGAPSAAESQQAVTDVSPANDEGLFASADPYKDQPEPSAFVLQRAQENGGSPPLISIDDKQEEPVAQTPEPAKPETRAVKINSQPPAKQEPKRKPSLQELPQSGNGVVLAVRHGLQQPGIYALTLEANQPFAAPRAAVSLADNRQYIDIPGAWQAGSNVDNRLAVEGFPLDAIRFGFGESRLRIVFDFSEPMAKPEVSLEGNQIRFLLKAAP